MADQSNSSGLLGVVLGAAIVVAVAIFFFGGFGSLQTAKSSMTYQPPITLIPQLPARMPASGKNTD